ncbi:hypothetical protein CXB51_019780 [Gossypium anomalum]|uniref:CCHC-type domain-containing protein n=1 Tax=Gossypium anomalum TaxID=47600 RepID=A0A8J6CWW7_9ROSI|nr:hypothetical protein CXB51_019780 [Gossypium anomalum]
MENSLKVFVGDDGSRISEDRNTKKVRFKDVIDGAYVDMAVDLDPPLNAAMSWKDKLFGTGSSGTSQEVASFEGVAMDSLWRPIQSFQLTDIENGYFLAKFQNKEDYDKVLTQGPWIIFGQYLTVQPWTKEFSLLQPYPSVVMAWIRLPGLPGFMYKRRILEAIGSMIGKMVKFKFKTDSKTRGKFARMALFINLDKPLISQICVNGEIQRVVYEALPTVCFTCGKYGHVRDLCPLSKEASDKVSDKVVANGDLNSKNSENDDKEKTFGPAFGPWMLVERKSRRRSGNTRDSGDMDAGKGRFGSRFNALTVEDDKTSGENEMLTDLKELNLQAVEADVSNLDSRE